MGPTWWPSSTFSLKCSPTTPWRISATRYGDGKCGGKCGRKCGGKCAGRASSDHRKPLVASGLDAASRGTASTIMSAPKRAAKRRLGGRGGCVKHQHHAHPPHPSPLVVAPQVHAQIGLKHANVVALWGVCLDPPRFSIVMEYASKGSLFDVLSCLWTDYRRRMRAARKLLRSHSVRGEGLRRAVAERRRGGGGASTRGSPSRRRGEGTESEGTGVGEDGQPPPPLQRAESAVPLKVLDAASCILDICRGMVNIHGSGYIHRDLKVRNRARARLLAGRASKRADTRVCGVGSTPWNVGSSVDSGGEIPALALRRLARCN